MIKNGDGKSEETEKPAAGGLRAEELMGARLKGNSFNGEFGGGQQQHLSAAARQIARPITDRRTTPAGNSDHLASLVVAVYF